MVKNPNWKEADPLAILQEWPRIWNGDYKEQIQQAQSGRGFLTILDFWFD